MEVRIRDGLGSASMGRIRIEASVSHEDDVIARRAAYYKARSRSLAGTTVLAVEEAAVYISSADGSEEMGRHNSARTHTS